MARHLDEEYQAYLMREGFRVGFKYGKNQCQSATVNMKSATENPTVVAEYLEKERLTGRVICPVRREDWPKVQVNRFGVIPKPHQPGKWRLIVDLSHPNGKSVNDGIEAELCSLRYTSVDEAVRRSMNVGRGSPSWTLRWPIELYRCTQRTDPCLGWRAVP